MQYDQLKQIACVLRKQIIENSHKSHTPHLGSCLSCVDILVALYFSKLRINPSKATDPLRDRCILSKGHGAPALFHVLAKRGYYHSDCLNDYGKDGGLFAEHPPTPDKLPGIEAATGSLGHGLPIGLGIALAARMQKREYNVYVVLGDGECNEGSIWEAAMLAAGQKVSNLCVIVDFNKWQATGRSQEILSLDPMIDKWRAFGWESVEVDGHNYSELLFELDRFTSKKEKPTAIIAHTTKGKGVSFMEDDNNWHYRIPTAEEVLLAQDELGECK
ncbi:transketolase [Ectothiorhodospiraceae bacterium BW-2]|nr:transketolase [Ectothiorhodospiraceae bacterium BW-2]